MASLLREARLGHLKDVLLVSALTDPENIALFERMEHLDTRRVAIEV